MNRLKVTFLLTCLTLLLAAMGRNLQNAATPATSRLFIVNPLTGSLLLKLFATHPPMEERIARLEALALSRG